MAGRAAQLGSDPRTVIGPGRKAAGGADRGPSARLPAVRGDDPGGALRRRHRHVVGHRHLAAGRGRGQRAGQGTPALPIRGAAADRRMASGPHQGQARRKARELVADQAGGRGRTSARPRGALYHLGPDQSHPCRDRRRCRAAPLRPAPQGAGPGLPRADAGDAGQGAAGRRGLVARVEVRRLPRPDPPRRRGCAADDPQRPRLVRPVRAAAAGLRGTACKNRADRRRGDGRQRPRRLWRAATRHRRGRPVPLLRLRPAGAGRHRPDGKAADRTAQGVGNAAEGRTAPGPDPAVAGDRGRGRGGHGADLRGRRRGHRQQAHRRPVAQRPFNHMA